MPHASHVIQYGLIKLIAINAPGALPENVAIALEVVIGCLIVVRTVFSSFYRKASVALWSLFRERESSRIVHRRRRFLLHAVRIALFTFLLCDFVNVMIEPYTIFKDEVRLKTLANLLYASALEFYFSYDTMNASTHLRIGGATVAYVWYTLYVHAGVSRVRFVELMASFLIFECLAWLFATVPILHARTSRFFFLPSTDLPSIFRCRLRHFILPQILINQLVTSSNSTLYIRLTIACATTVGIFHALSPRHSLFYGAGSWSLTALHFPGSQRVPELYGHYSVGIISVSDFEATSLMKDATDIEEQLRSFDPYVASQCDKIAALSYKHYMPYVLEEISGEARRAVKLSDRDFGKALHALKGFTHVWTDFAQNARSTRHQENEAAWFERGVAPFVNFEVVSFWTEDEARDSMWIRLEEMAGVLGKGLLDASTPVLRRREGLGMTLEAALLQLGARACVGELAGCRESYAKDVDEISRRYGEKLLNMLYGYGPWTEASGEEYEDDFVYRSQVTINILVPISGLMETNSVESCQGLSLIVGRRRGSTHNNEDSVGCVSNRLQEQFPDMKLLSSPPLDNSVRPGSSFDLDLACEITSAVGTKFRSICKAKMNEIGNIQILDQRWVGERNIDLRSFQAVPEGVSWIRGVDVDKDSVRSDEDEDLLSV